MAKKQNLDLNRLLPQALKSETLSGLVSNLFNRFVSQEKSVLINGRIGKPLNDDPMIAASSLEREVNALVPAIYSKTATDEQISVFDDIVNKLKVLNADVNNMQAWMREQYFNFAPPVNFDKFVNFSQYYWIGHLVNDAGVFEGNPSNKPVYYVAERPERTDVQKMPVRLVTTRDIKLKPADRDDETITLTFTSSTNFTVTSTAGTLIVNSTSPTGPITGSLVGLAAGLKTQITLYARGFTQSGSTYGIQKPFTGTEANDAVISFTIENGLIPFTAGDKFEISVEHRTSNIQTAFIAAVSSSKGNISGATSVIGLMFIDGVRVKHGDRILAAHQNNAAHNGIYTVNAFGPWTRAVESVNENDLPVGSKIFVNEGTANAGKIYELSLKTPPYVGFNTTASVPLASQLQFTDVGVQPNNISPWQEINFWYHRDDFDKVTADFKISLDDAIQAQRPIVEYDKELKLNAAVIGGTPCDSITNTLGQIITVGQEARQIITNFNQAPQFDLYYYDGTHAGKTSSIFFYRHDSDFDVDEHLGFRAKLTGDYDFVFGHGLTDEDNRLLFFKRVGDTTSKLDTIWSPGLSTAKVVSINTPSVGSISIVAGPLADTETWTLTRSSAGVFSMVGERSGVVGDVVVGTPFVFNDVTVFVTPASYSIGDTFTFDVLNTSFPRYVRKSNAGEITNYPGGISNDGLDGEYDGTWATPLRMFQNLARESRAEISHGDLLNHFRSTIRAQDGFQGISFGNNNVRTLPFNVGYGGTIREYAKEFPLFVSMLLQKDISPVSLIDYAEQQYLLALTSVDAFVAENLPKLLSAGNSISLTMIDPMDQSIMRLLNALETDRKQNAILGEVYSDSTAGVANWPITLPMMGLTARVMPTIEFDHTLGASMIVHHDGHKSPVLSRNFDTDRELVRTVVARSDGTESAGFFSETMPLTPFAGQMWLRPSTFELRIFDVTYDTASQPQSALAGQLWFNRNTGQIFEWDPISQAWLATALTVATQWKPFSIDIIRNSLILAVEKKLYDSVHPLTTVKSTLVPAETSQYMLNELASFASKYSYDTFGVDYDASDAFTWNYSNAVIPGIASPSPARWFDLYTQHFDIPGFTVATSQPHVEPWKLLNHASKPSNWDALYALTLPISTVALPAVNAVSVVNIPALSGLPTIDGVALTAGMRVLLVNQTSNVQNGIWVVSSGSWIRALDIILFNSSIAIISGTNFASTVWYTVSPTAGPIQIGLTPMMFSMDKQWHPQMWRDIKAVIPGVKLCVDIHRDTLLPPYVALSNSAASEALLNSIPAGVNERYSFGDNGPVENLWKKSLEFKYALARSAFRLNPLSFLHESWGDTYMSSYTGGLPLERDTMSLHSHTTYLLHGERLHNVRSIPEADLHMYLSGSIVAADPINKAHDIKLVVALVEDNRTVFDVIIDGVIYAHISEGVTYPSLTFGDVTFTGLAINDMGKPFQLGDTFTITTFDDIVDPSFVPTESTTDECVGCVVEGTMESTVPMVPVETLITFTAKQSKIFNGFGQVFTNILRSNFTDTLYSDAVNMYRAWDIKLVHRLGALIRPDTLKIDTIQGVLPTTGYSVVLKRSPAVDNLWITALRVQLVSMGSRTTNKYNTLVPSNDASDWVFRIETYNTKNPVIEKYTFDQNGDYQTFHALAKATTDRAWKRLTTVQSIDEIALPVTITGLQNVVDFLFGYIELLNDRGWKIYAYDYSTTDAETGRNLDWQLEVEKLVDRVYKGMNAGEGHILNPFMSSLTLATPRGLLSQFTPNVYSDMFSMQGVYDVTCSLIPISNLNVLRTDEQAVTFSQTPMFAAHVFIDDYEHAIVFNSQFSDEIGAAKLFDSFLGARIDTAFLNLIRQENPNGKPTFDGFFLSGNDIKRNISSSIDSMASYYDAATTFYEPDTARHATALLGYTKKDYFDQISTNDTTQFNFWRGLIQAKGTNMTIDAFVNYKKFTDASVDEYWAYKIAEYGDAREKTLPEIKINPLDATQKYLRLQFYSGQDTSVDLLPLFTHIENTDDARWFSIDDLGKGMKFEAQQISETFIADSSNTFPMYVKLKNVYHTGDSASANVAGPYDATMVTSRIAKVAGPGEYTVTGITWLNPVKHSPMKLIDYENSAIVSDIPLWHPAIGIHSQQALELVDMISVSDPARYNVTTQTVDNENYHITKPWAKREVGRVWWDVSDLSYIPYDDSTFFGNRDARLQRWGLIADWSSIKLNEWVESTVHPSEYDALASEQEGSADIDSRLKASGKVAIKRHYKRDRIISRRPIAWSRAGVGNANAHPAFGPAEYTKVYANGKRLIPDFGRCDDINLVPGRNFGAWMDGKPVGEVQILADDVKFIVGSLTDPSSAVIIPQAISSGIISNVWLSPIDNSRFGTKIGRIYIRRKNFGNGVEGIRLMAESGEYEDQRIDDWFSDDENADNTMIVQFDTFGLRLHITRSTFGVTPISQSDIVHAVTNDANDIFVREAIAYTEIVPLPDFVFINDENDPEYLTTDYEWRTWEVPTAAQLNADLLTPFNEWLAYPGDFTVVAATPSIITEMKSANSKFVMKDGSIISRFQNTWTDWVVLSDSRYEIISDGASLVTFNLSEDVSANRISVYANGSQVKPAGYVIYGNRVQLVAPVAEGTTITLLNRAYHPTEAELSFDPEVSDNFSAQSQFKLDYEFTLIEQRDVNGSPVQPKYYFWVTDKSIPRNGKSMSLTTAAQQLQFGPDMYAVLARAIPTPDEQYVAHFDSCAVAGLGSFVTRENAFKIRFLRDFTLRDDPEEMRLKNIHSEWKLIRRGQGTKIPTTLWELVTSAAAGIDAGGNPVPSQARIDYDERNGTAYRYGFGTGQIFADSDLVKASIIDTILNTQLTLRIGDRSITDYITALDLDANEEWFSTPEKARQTMDLIYRSARASQVNEIFFNVLEDALANNIQFTDLFKTSFITVSSSTRIIPATQQEQQDEFF